MESVVGCGVVLLLRVIGVVGGYEISIGLVWGVRGAPGLAYPF